MGRNMECGSRRAPWRSPFRAVEWGEQHGRCNILSVKKIQAWSFLPSIPTHLPTPHPPPLTPAAKDARASAANAGFV